MNSTVTTEILSSQTTIDLDDPHERRTEINDERGNISMSQLDDDEDENLFSAESSIQDIPPPPLHNNLIHDDEGTRTGAEADVILSDFNDSTLFL